MHNIFISVKFIGFLTRATSVVRNCFAGNFQTHILLLLLFNRMKIKAKTKVLVSAQVVFFVVVVSIFRFNIINCENCQIRLLVSGS